MSALSARAVLRRALWNGRTWDEADRIADWIERQFEEHGFVTIQPHPQWTPRPPMATDDVPGKNPANADKLAMGCWAEAADNAKDQSLIFVEAVEGGNVVFSVFDPETDVEYREAMAQKEFETFFSFDPKKAAKDTPRWTWHDKTPFPWQRIMKDMKPGPRPSSFSSAAKKVAAALGWRAKQLDKTRGARTVDGASVVRGIVERIKTALDEHVDEHEGE